MKKKPPHRLRSSNSKDVPHGSLTIKPDTAKRGRRDRFETPHRSHSRNSRGYGSSQAHASNTKKAATAMRVPKPPHLKRVDAGSKNLSVRTLNTYTGVHSRNPLLGSITGTGTGYSLRRHQHTPQLSPEDASRKLKSWIRRRLLLRTISQPGCLARRVEIKIDHEARLSNIRQRFSRRIVRRFLSEYVVQGRSLRKASSSRGNVMGDLPLIKKMYDALLQNALSARCGIVDPVHQRPLRYKMAVVRIEQAWLRSKPYRTLTRRLQFHQLLERSENIERRDLVRLRFSFMVHAHQLFYNSQVMLLEGAARRPFLSHHTSLFDATDVSSIRGASFNQDEALVLANSLSSSSTKGLLRYLCGTDDEPLQGEAPSEDDIIREFSRRLLFSKEEWKLLKEVGRRRLEEYQDLLRDTTVFQNAQDEMVKCNCGDSSLGSCSCAANLKKISHSPSMKTSAIMSTTCVVPYFLAQRRFFESGLSSDFYGSAYRGREPNKPPVEHNCNRCILSDGFILHTSTVERSPLFHEYEVARKIDRDHSKTTPAIPLDDSLVISGYSSRMAEFYLRPATSLYEYHPLLRTQTPFPTSSIILGGSWADFLQTLQEKQGNLITYYGTRRKTESEKASLCSAPHEDKGPCEERGRGGGWSHDGRDEPVQRRRCGLPHHLLFRTDDAAATSGDSEFFIEDCIESFKKKTCGYDNLPLSSNKTHSFQNSRIDTRKENSSLKSLNETGSWDVESEGKESQNWLKFLHVVEQLLIQEHSHRNSLFQNALAQHYSLVRLLAVQAGGGRSAMLRGEQIV
ncbi:unnamed protein product [Phytomonas sp. EM1]|nr:unnamed protein product [Phytomonas sp. EM1]|eukprot:CCW60035.1 unnamed protein product [Phytomonas sp. isolate EM1]